MGISRSKMWRDTIHGFALWLMLLPFAGLSMLAHGVMPGRAADGQMILVLCTPDGPREMVVDALSGTPGPDHQEDARCAWAQAHVLADLEPGPQLAAFPMTVSRAAPATAYQHFRPAHDPRGIFARGPPTLL